MRLSQDIDSPSKPAGFLAWLSSLFGHKPVQETSIDSRPFVSKPSTVKAVEPHDLATLNWGKTVSVPLPKSHISGDGAGCVSHLPASLADLSGVNSPSPEPSGQVSYSGMLSSPCYITGMWLYNTITVTGSRLYNNFYR